MAIDELARKMDGFGVSPDPETLRYLEAAINELRELSAGVASAEGVASIAGDVQALGARIDHLALVSGASGLDSLAQRVNDLTQALDSRVEQMGPLPNNIEALIASINDKLDRSDSAPHDQAAFAQIERRIFLLLAVVYPDADMELIHAGMQDSQGADGARRRANAVELLDNLLERGLKKRFLPLLEELPRAERLRAVAEVYPQTEKTARNVLAELVKDETAWVRACATWTLSQTPGDGVSPAVTLSSLAATRRHVNLFSLKII